MSTRNTGRVALLLLCEDDTQGTPRYERAAQAGLATPRRAADAFVGAVRDGEGARVPSLADARHEAQRLPL